MVSSKLERKLRYQHVYDLVLAIVADRNLKPGDRQPSTTELAEVAEVSSISVRRADNILERAVLPLSRVPAIDRGPLAEGGSLYRFIEERYALQDDYTERAFEVDTPSTWEAEHPGPIRVVDLVGGPLTAP